MTHSIMSRMMARIIQMMNRRVIRSLRALHLIPCCNILMMEIIIWWKDEILSRLI